MKQITNKIKVSVVVPAYNEEKFLPDCLMSLLKQDFDQKFEIIVVDNNSSDNTAKTAEDLGVKVVTEKRAGVCFARQAGTKAAHGDIIVSTDADCTFPANWLANIYKSFQNNSELIAVIGSFQFTPKPKWGRVYSSLLFRAVKEVFARTGKIIYTPASNFGFKKESWQKIGGYNTALTQGGDENDLYKRISKTGKTTYLFDNAVLTSSRRLGHGIVYSLFVSLIGYYILDYYVAARVTGKSILGTYPACREHYENRKRNWGIAISSFVITILFTLLAGNILLEAMPAKAENSIRSHSGKAYSVVKSGTVKHLNPKKILKNKHFHKVKPQTLNG